MDNLQQNLSTLQAMGLTLPTPAYIFGATLFGFIGLYAWMRGRRLKLPVFKWLGVALMAYPLVVPDTLLMYVVGGALCVALYCYRDY